MAAHRRHHDLIAGDKPDILGWRFQWRPVRSLMVEGRRGLDWLLIRHGFLG